MQGPDLTSASAHPTDAQGSTDASGAVDPSPRLVETGRRSRKKQMTRDRLVAAANDLFSSQGYEATTTAHIAEAADVAQRTLFRHFETKEALLYADMDDARLELRDALRARPPAESALGAVVGALESLGANFETYRDQRLRQAELAAVTPAVSGHFRAVVQAGWEREIIVAVAERLGVDPLVDPRPEILAGAAMSACRAATRQWTANGGRDDYVALLRDVLDRIPDAIIAG